MDAPWERLRHAARLVEPPAPHGYKVIRLLFDETGRATGEYEDFMTGFVVSDKKVWGRPVGVAVGKDGSPFVTEDGNGTIWRVTHGGGAGAPAARTY